LEIQRLGFWGNFGRVWLLFEVNGMEIVVGLFIGKANRVTFGQKVSRLGFVTVKNSKNHHKRVMFEQNVTQSTLFKKFLAQKSCHVLVNVSRFRNVERTSILT